MLEITVGVSLCLALVATILILRWLDRRRWCFYCEYVQRTDEDKQLGPGFVCDHSEYRKTRVPLKNKPDMCPLEFGIRHRSKQ